MNVKVTLGRNLLKERREENEQKLRRMEFLLEEKEKEINELKSEIKQYKTEINNKQNDVLEAFQEKEKLMIQIQGLINEQFKLKQTIQNNIQINRDLYDSNKKLQKEIEILNSQLDRNENDMQKQKIEYDDMEKIKSDFENRIIALTKINETQQNKIQSFENIIKQKDKYIQMLVLKKKNSDNRPFTTTTPNTSGTNSKKFKNNEQKFQISNSNTHTSIANMKLQINEKNKQILDLEEKIKKIQNDNNNLVIRLRNMNK